MFKLRLFSPAEAKHDPSPCLPTPQLLRHGRGRGDVLTRPHTPDPPLPLTVDRGAWNEMDYELCKATGGHASLDSHDSDTGTENTVEESVARRPGFGASFDAIFSIRRYSERLRSLTS